MPPDPKLRFSDRAQEYKKYRPTYPLEAVEFIKDQCKINVDSTIADIGSGTGISTEILIKVFGCPLYAVEPNDAMRAEAENTLSSNSLFHSIKGCSENTTLQSESITLISAFQAFHWFNKEKTRLEFNRILKDQQWVVLVWNDRKTSQTPFLEGYETLLRELPNYKTTSHKNIDLKEIQAFIGNDAVLFAEFSNAQSLDLEGLQGRFFSSSYTPPYGTDAYKKQIANLEKLFEMTNKNGSVEFLYSTQVFIGQLKGGMH